MKILMIGFGSIGQGLIALLRQYLSITSIHIITAHKKGFNIANKYKASIEVNPLSQKNYKKILAQQDFDLLINVSVNVSSTALIEWCQENNKLYIDTCIEPWEGGYVLNDIEKTTNYYLRQQALNIKGNKTAIISHGANPGLVSHFVKAALDQLKSFFKINEQNYCKLLHDLKIKIIQVAEHDTQVSKYKYNKNTFVNTWSVDGFISEVKQFAEIGTNENLKGFSKYKASPCSFGDLSIYLNTPGYQTKVKSWTPSYGNIDAYLITHHEATSLSDKFTYKLNRPTVYFAYVPCPQALEKWHLLDTAKIKQKVIKNNIVSGHDELGVLLISEHFSYWYGSVLNHKDVKVPHNSATSLQVTISMIASILWMIENPNNGITEAEDICHHFILDIAKSYLGEYGGTFSDFKTASLTLKDFLI